MDVRWYCYRFDYAEYVRLRPALRAATTAVALASVSQSPEGLEGPEGPEVEAIVESWMAGEITLPAARVAIVQAICCRGEPLPFDPGLSRIISRFERTEGMEEAAHLLTGLLSGGRNLEPWLQPAAGLAGFLTPTETSALYVAFSAFRGRSGRLRRGSGGLIPGLVALVRHLLDHNSQPEEILRLLSQLLESAVRHDDGIAAIIARRT